MKVWINQLISRIIEFWNKYTGKQKTLILSVGAAVIVTLVCLYFVLSRTDYEALPTFEDTKTAAEASRLLDENGIEHRLSNDALTIEVDSKKISNARLVLGENGISSTVNSTDYDWLFDNSFNTTDSEKQLKAKITTQSKMADAISTMDGVSKASVTLDIPKSSNSIYAGEDVTSVSIMLTTNSGFQRESVNAIAEYASTSVGNPDTSRVTIIDSSGNLLFSGTNNSSISSQALDLKNQLNDQFKNNLWNLYVSSGVFDEVSVAADLDINLADKHIENTEFYSNDEDDTGPKASSYYYLAKNVDGDGGLVGTDANDEVTDYNLLDGTGGESTLTVMKDTYNTSSTVTITTEPVGEVDMTQSSMSVFLTKYIIYEEGALEDAGELENMTFAEFKTANSEIEEVIDNEQTVSFLSSATGIKANKIKVTERYVPLFYEKEETPLPVATIISVLLAIFIGVLLLLVVIKGMKPAEVIEVEPELSVEALLATTRENQTLDDIEFSDKSAVRSMIEKFVDENPEAVASLLRNWLSDEWE